MTKRFYGKVKGEQLFFQIIKNHLILEKFKREEKLK